MAKNKNKNIAAAPVASALTAGAEDPIVTITSVDGTSVSASPRISPPETWQVLGTVTYPKALPPDRWWIQFQTSRSISPTFTPVSDDGTTVVQDYSFDLEAIDVGSNGTFTLFVNASNATLTTTEPFFRGGVGTGDASVECAGFPFPSPTPTPSPPPAPPPTL